MTRIRPKLSLLLCLALAGPGLASISLAADPGLVAIVNPANELDEVSARDLARIYRLSRRRWPNGVPISLYLPPAASDEADLLARRLLNLGGERDIFGFYLRAIFRQKIAEVPETLSGPDAAIQRIARDPGGIALLPSDQVTTSGPVRVIRVDGL